VFMASDTSEAINTVSLIENYLNIN